MIVQQMIINQDTPVFIFNVTHPRLQIARMTVKHITMKVNSPLRAGNHNFSTLYCFIEQHPYRSLAYFVLKSIFLGIKCYVLVILKAPTQ